VTAGGRGIRDGRTLGNESATLRHVGAARDNAMWQRDLPASRVIGGVRARSLMKRRER